MSPALSMRPAARSAAMRPHSASLPAPRPGFPRPARASPCSCSLFFVPSPRPYGRQSYWSATAFRPPGLGGVVTVTAMVTAMVTSKPLRLLDIPPPLPRYHSPPAHVIRSRPRTCAILSLPLVTWEQRNNILLLQGLDAFPRPLPRLRPVGTWEQPKSAALASDGLRAGSNKLETGNGDLQRAGGDARRKFRAPIARDLVAVAAVQAAGELELQRIRQLPTRRSDNGGKLRFFSAAAEHVGTAMLEGSRQGTDVPAEIGQRLKLGRLHGIALGVAGGAALAISPKRVTGALLAQGHPGTPNRARPIAGMLALHAARIWIETENGSIEAAQSGSIHDRQALPVSKIAFRSCRQRGPGGAGLSIATEIAMGTHNRRAEERAGVNLPASIAQPHEAGEFWKLRRDLAAVNGSLANG